jgi:hypothetical protein
LAERRQPITVHGFQKSHSKQIAKKRLFPGSEEGIYKTGWEYHSREVRTTARRRSKAVVEPVSNRHYGREDEADRRNVMSK